MRLMRDWLDSLMRYEHTQFSDGQGQGKDWLRFLQHEFERTEQGRHTLTKDAPDRNWYIVVRAPSGLMCYDGWWHESTGKTWREALEEAKRGAFLTHFKEQPNDR